MSTSIGGNTLGPVAATNIRCDETMLHVELSDGREISVPLAWFPKLSAATSLQRNNWRLIGNGVGIRWEDLDEDISISGLLVNK